MTATKASSTNDENIDHCKLLVGVGEQKESFDKHAVETRTQTLGLGLGLGHADMASDTYFD